MYTNSNINIKDVKFNLRSGEKIFRIKGLPFIKQPIDIKVVDEYPSSYLLFMKFRENPNGALSVGYMTSVSKARLLCHDIDIVKENGEKVRAFC